MACKLLLNLVTDRSLQSKEDGRELLRLWTKLLPEYIPERFGNHEPIRLQFNTDDIEKVLDHWHWPFLVKRQKPGMQGTVFMGGRKKLIHGWITVRFDFRPAYQNLFIEFFKTLAVQFTAEFGFLHFEPRDQRLSVSTNGLRQYIPDLFWATIFGKGYVDMFGREIIRACGAPVIEELDEDLFYIQASQELRDLEKNAEEVFQTREQIKMRLNNNAFFNPALGPDHMYSVPLFAIQPDVSKGLIS